MARGDDGALRILGVDPGSRVAGFGLLDQAGRTLRVVESGVFRLGEKDELAARLGRLLDAIEGLLDRGAPSVLAVEDVFAARNPRSALALGQARGVILAAAGRRGIPVFAYPPATVKRAVCGNGRAEKEQVRKMVSVLLSLSTEVPLDESDALALAICHGLSARAQALLGGSEQLRTASLSHGSPLPGAARPPRSARR
jgi:crossover junction endodeoxyribonuclease RuvC